MDIQEYMQKRVDDEISWFSQRAEHEKRCYKAYQTIEIILAALIPVLSGYTSYKFVPFLIGVIGAVIAILGSIQKLNKYHENWIQYRTTCELLKNEKFLFITKSHPYNETDEVKGNIFVKNIEALIASETKQWKSAQATTIKLPQAEEKEVESA